MLNRSLLYSSPSVSCAVLIGSEVALSCASLFPCWGSRLCLLLSAQRKNSMNKWHLLALIGTAYYYCTDFFYFYFAAEAVEKLQGSMYIAWPYYFIYSIDYIYTSDSKKKKKERLLFLQRKVNVTSVLSVFHFSSFGFLVSESALCWWGPGCTWDGFFWRNEE